MATKSTSRKRSTAKPASKRKAAKTTKKGSATKKATTRKTSRTAAAKPKSAAAKKAGVKKGSATTANARPAKPAKKAASGKKAATVKKSATRTGKRSTAKSTRARKSAAPRPVRPKSVDKKYKHLGKALLKKQEELMQAYAAAKTDTRDRMDDGTEDYIDYAVNSYAKDFMLSLTELERQQLQLVREALHRLGRGEYGACLQCGVEIPDKRLEVAPWVRYCIACQELEDQGLLPQQPLGGFDEEDVEEEADDDEALDGDDEDDGEDEVSVDADVVDADDDDDED